MTVDQSVAGRRAGYISVSNNDDATCIAWITVQQPDNTQGGAWTGDVGYQCGQRWYNSVEPAGRLKDEQGGGEYVPKCTWIDANHSNDIASAALKFDVSAYGENVVDTANSDACAPTIYGADNGPLAGGCLLDALTARNCRLTTVYRSSRQTQSLCTTILDDRSPHHIELYEPAC